jgi:hypothetical protein
MAGSAWPDGWFSSNLLDNVVGFVFPGRSFRCECEGQAAGVSWSTYGAWLVIIGDRRIFLP